MAASYRDYINVHDFGAWGRDDTDDAPAINAAIAWLSANTGGGLLYIPPGNYRIASPIELADDITVQAAEGATIVLPVSASFAALDLDSVSRVSISRLAVRCLGTPTSTCRAFYVRGSSSQIVFTKCLATACGVGFDVRGDNGTVPGTVEDVEFNRCEANGQLVTYGFNAAHADRIIYLDCLADGNYLDGFKLTALTTNVRIVGGASRNNGQHPSENGDGIDAYAGGDTFVIDGIVCESNNGNGITIKTDSLTRDDPANYGYVWNAQILNVQCRYNTAFGMGIYVFTGSGTNSYNDPTGTPSIPMPRYVHVVGGVFEENESIGLFLNGMGVVCDGSVVRRNGEDGIEVGVRSMWTTINDPVLVANNQNGGVAHNLYLRGKWMRVNRPQFFGVDPDVCRTAADLVGTPTATTNITVDSTYSEDVEIYQPTEDPTSVNAISINMTSGRCVVHRRGSGSPNGVVRGGVGSTWEQDDYLPNGAQGIALWQKVSGAPNTNTGWRLATDRATLVAPGNIALAAGWGDAATFAIEAGSTDKRGRIVVTSAGVGQASQPGVTLTFADGAFPTAPFARVTRNLGSGSSTIRAAWQQPTTTTLTMILLGTPVAGSSYGLEWETIP